VGRERVMEARNSARGGSAACGAMKKKKENKVTQEAGQAGMRKKAMAKGVVSYRR